MLQDLRLTRLLRILGVPVFVALAGCGGGNTDKSYHPPAASARDALTVALKAWQEGNAKPGRIDLYSVPLQVADPVWSKGKKLKSFEIVQEEPLSDGPTKFAVKLTLDGVPEAQSVAYVVIGKDPLWILREEEYQRSGGM